MTSPSRPRGRPRPSPQWRALEAWLLSLVLVALLAAAVGVACSQMFVLPPLTETETR